MATRPKCQCGDEHGGVIRRAAHERRVRLVSPKHMTAWFSGVHNWGPLLFGRSVDEHGGVTGRAASERGVRFVSPRHMTAWFSGVHKLGATCDFVSDKQSPVVQELPHQRHLWGFEPTLGDPIGLAGRRLGRSAKVSMWRWERESHRAGCKRQRGSACQPKTHEGLSLCLESTIRDNL